MEEHQTQAMAFRCSTSMPAPVIVFSSDWSCIGWGVVKGRAAKRCELRGLPYRRSRPANRCQAQTVFPKGCWR